MHNSCLVSALPHGWRRRRSQPDTSGSRVDTSGCCGPADCRSSCRFSTSSGRAGAKPWPSCGAHGRFRGRCPCGDCRVQHRRGADDYRPAPHLPRVCRPPVRVAGHYGSSTNDPTDELVTPLKKRPFQRPFRRRKPVKGASDPADHREYLDRAGPSCKEADRVARLATAIASGSSAGATSSMPGSDIRVASCTSTRRPLNGTARRSSSSSMGTRCVAALRAGRSRAGGWRRSCDPGWTATGHLLPTGAPGESIRYAVYR